MRLFFLILLFLAATASTLRAGEYEEPLADQLRERFKSEPFSLGILLQAQGAFSLRDNDFNGGHAWDLGSTRIDFRGTVDRDFTYRVRVYFLSQQQSIDARIGYRFSDQFQIIAGAFKPYMSRELDPSPANLHFVRRARLVGAMMNTLEIGMSAIGELGSFQYRLGMYNGDGVFGITRPNDNRFLYTSRFSYGVALGEHQKMELGINASINQSRAERVGNTGLTSAGDRLIYGGYADYDSRLIFVTAEYMQSRFDAVDFGGSRETITGVYTTLGFKVDPRNEALIRWDHLGFDLRGDRSERFLLGWNYYPTSLVSFRVNALMEFREDEKTQFGLTGVFQYHF